VLIPLSRTESLVQTPVFPEPQGDEEQDDSMGERTMASKLLDDTTDELQPGPGRRQLPRNKTFSNLAQFAHPDKNKSLPQLPDLERNGDRAWPMMNAPVGTADGNANRTYFHGDEGSYMSAAHGEHSRENSPPPIPPKSSKRKSGPKNTHGKIQEGNETVRRSIVHPKPAENIDVPTPKKYDNNDSVVEAMQTATRNLKGNQKGNPKGNSKGPLKISAPTNFRHVAHTATGAEKDTVQESLRSTVRPLNSTDQTLLQGTYVPTKEKSFKAGKMFAKMKNALQGNNSRSRHNSGMNQRLLDDFPGDSQECGQMGSMGTGLNEGELANPSFTPYTN
jgi:hypothetical protein